MRKLLMPSSALVAAASLSSYAVADVSVSGGFEWRYTSVSSGIAASDGTEFGTDNTVTIKFTNKTDTGLSLLAVHDMDSDGTGDDAGVTDVGSDASLFYKVNLRGITASASYARTGVGTDNSVAIVASELVDGAEFGFGTGTDTASATAENASGLIRSRDRINGSANFVTTSPLIFAS